MRKPVVILLLLALLAIMAWWLWSRRAGHTAGSPGVASHQAERSVSPQADVGQAKANGAKPDLKTQLHEVMTSANRPINFYGKVIDQDGNAISGVKVALQIRRTKEVGPAGIGDTFDFPTLTTGEDGRFSLTGAAGALLAVKSLEKAGYEPSPKALRSSYWYWRDKDAFVPNSEQPEIFRMWKKIGAERLVDQEKMTRIPYNGTSVEFDLLTGAKVDSGGDIRVTLLRNPREINYGQRNYEWTLTVEAVDGGVMESKDEQPYLAPADGYQPKFVIHMPADDPKWTDERAVALYLKTRAGKNYGRITLEVSVGSDKPTTGLSFRSFVNPNSSRNLEYDSRQSLVKSPTSTP